MIRLLIDGVFFQLNTTGIARVWKSVIPLLVKSKKFEIYFLDRGQSPDIEGIEYIPFPQYQCIYTPADSFLIQNICEHYNIDIFTSTYYTTPIITPMILLVHDMIPELFDFDLEARIWLEKETAISYSQRYICVSHNTCNDLIAFYPEIPPDCITVAHGGIDENIFYPRDKYDTSSFKKKYGLNRPYFLFVGDRVQHNGYKNCQLFFSALTQMTDAQFDVLFVGGNEEIEPEILDNLPSGIQCNRVVLTDDELAMAYGGAIALVYPSLYEGFGLPVIEAFASGCPVITTHNGSLQEVAESAAYIISGTSIDEMQHSLMSIQNSEVHNEFKQKGLNRAKLFRWDTIADALINQSEILLAEVNDGQYDHFFKEWQRLRYIQASVDDYVA